MINMINKERNLANVNVQKITFKTMCTKFLHARIEVIKRPRSPTYSVPTQRMG